ncbi:MAG: plasmid mobilization relaxosome protein MobC [Lachnospiraceae bacterium]|nr:plasmid mobilization relaxosome protein MobC [Lachnospiraceae bacterium]
MSITRTNQINLKFSDHEMELLQQKMELAGIHNRSAYLRKMAIDGMIFNVNMTEIKEMLRLQVRTSANMNQIAKRCNETGNLYEEDIKELQEGYEEQTEQMKKVVEQVATLKRCC